MYENHAQCRYSAAPIIREKTSGSVLNSRLCQPEVSSVSVRNLFSRKLYLKYSIGRSSAPHPSLKRRKPWLASEALPKSNTVEPLRACHLMASHITRLFPRKCWKAMSEAPYL